jgi:hypothetical protein
VRVRPGGLLQGQAVTVTGGRIEADGRVTAPVQLNGGVLAGIGEVAAAVTNSAGTVAPGRPLGTLKVQSYTQGAGGTLEAEIEGGGVICAGFDTLEVASAPVLGGTLAIRNDPSFVPQAGAEFLVVKHGAPATGQFGTVTGDRLADGRRHVAQYRAEGVALVSSAAPEPVSLGLLAPLPPGAAPLAVPAATSAEAPLAPTAACSGGPVRVRIAVPRRSARARLSIDGAARRRVSIAALRRGVLLGLDRARPHTVRVDFRTRGGGRRTTWRLISACPTEVPR